MRFLLVYIVSTIAWAFSAASGFIFAATVSAWVAGFVVGAVLANAAREYRISRLLGKNETFWTSMKRGLI